MNRIARIAVVGLIGMALSGAALAQTEPLALVVQDAIAQPGGIAAIVLKTYSSRPVGQGQVCLKVSGRPFVSTEATYIPAPKGEVTKRSQTVDAHTFMVQFQSPTAAVNRIEGPMLVVYFRVSPTARAGQLFDIELDMLNTFLQDAGGGAVLIEPSPGQLTIRAPGAPFHFAAEGDRIAPGDTALLSAETNEPIRLSSGQATFVYNPALASGPAEVAIPPVYGNSTYTVDDSIPGRVVVNFISPNSSLGALPGGFISVRLPTSPAVPLGTRAPIALDPAGTFLIDRRGRTLALAIEDGELRFE